MKTVLFLLGLIVASQAVKTVVRVQDDHDDDDDDYLDGARIRFDEDDLVDQVNNYFASNNEAEFCDILCNYFGYVDTNVADGLLDQDEFADALEVIAGYLGWDSEEHPPLS